MNYEKAFFGGADCICIAAHETGTTVAEIVRKMGITEQTFYHWKKKFGG